MTKYLSVIQEDSQLGLCFYDDKNDNFEIFAIRKSNKLEEMIKEHSPDLIISRENFAPSLPSLNLINASQHKKLERQIVQETIFIEGLERKTDEGYYPVYYFRGQKLSKREKWAIYSLYLYKPWGLQKVKLPTEIDNFGTDKKKLSQEQIKKILNNMNLELKELIEKITNASKLSYLTSLNSEEISVLLKNVKDFKIILEQIYPLKKQEEEKNKTNLKSEYVKENKDS